MTSRKAKIEEPADPESIAYRRYLEAQKLKPGIYEPANFVVSHLEGMIAAEADVSKRQMVQSVGKGADRRSVVYMKFHSTCTAEEMCLFLNTILLDRSIKFFADKSGQFVCAMGPADVGDFYSAFIAFARHFGDVRAEDCFGLESERETERKTVVLPARGTHPRINGSENGITKNL